LDPINIDSPISHYKPHSRLAFHGSDIHARLKQIFENHNPPIEFRQAGPAFMVRLAPVDCAVFLEIIGFKREIDGSNCFHRMTDANIKRE